MGKLIIFLSRRCATINYTQHVKQHLQMRLLNDEFMDEMILLYDGLQDYQSWHLVTFCCGVP